MKSLVRFLDGRVDGTEGLSSVVVTDDVVELQRGSDDKWLRYRLDEVLSIEVTLG